MAGGSVAEKYTEVGNIHYETEPANPASDEHMPSPSQSAAVEILPRHPVNDEILKTLHILTEEVKKLREQSAAKNIKYNKLYSRLQVFEGTKEKKLEALKEENRELVDSLRVKIGRIMMTSSRL